MSDRGPGGAANAAAQTVDQEAIGLAEGNWTKVGLKIPEDRPSGAKLSILESTVYARLRAKHRSMPHSVLHDAAHYGVTVAQRDYGTTPLDVPLSPTAAVGGAVLGVADSAKAAIDQAQSIAGFLGEITDPTTWLRAVYIVGGGILVLSGVFIIAKELGATVPEPPIIAPIAKASAMKAKAKMKKSAAKKAKATATQAKATKAKTTATKAKAAKA